MSSAYLILADGTVFQGKAIGLEGTTIGETVFTTGMTGYLETLTDPSYFGQIVTQTFPLIGNYGVIPQDFESKKSWVRGYIVREICDEPSNFRCQETLDKFLKDQKITGIFGIDTRALTKRLRESGVMNGMIISGVNEAPKITDELLQKIKDYKIQNAVETVSCNEGESDVLFSDKTESETKLVREAFLPPGLSQNVFAAPPSPKGTPLKNPVNYHIVLWDFGAKANIQRELEKRGCKVTVVPSDTTADQILKLNPDGLMLSNGPGDPADNTGIIGEIKKICDYAKLPIFGICLGHQMLALARGAKTSKLKYGHRGGNHPVKDTQTDRVYITSQNHGYAVENTSLPAYAKMSFFNVNDGTVEGITYADIPAFSVQFHPEACGGPHDTNFLFDRFMECIEVNK